MSDVAGAPAPAMETIGEAATNRLEALRRDPEFGARRLAGDAGAVNEHRTLLHILHGEGLDDAARLALATSIQLAPRPTLAAAARAKAEADAAASATRLQLPFEVAGTLTPEERTNLATDVGAWAGGLNLPTSNTRIILDRISAEGARVAGMTDADRAAWLAKQEAMLVGAAGSKERAAEWRASAEKLLAGKKYNLKESPVLSDAFVIRHLAMAAAAKK
jgi:hypothetical protein